MEDSNPQYKGKGVHWVTEPSAPVPIKLGKEGIAAIEPVTVIKLLREATNKWPDKVVLNVKRDNAWKTWTWKQYHDQIMQCARAILSFKPNRFQGVNIIGFNSPEWLIADIATIAAGCIVAPIYSTNGPDAVHYIADHSEGIVAFTENEQQTKKFLEIRERLPHLKAIVQWSGAVAEGSKDVYSWEDFLKLGDSVEASELENVISELKPENCATLIYTSGTTGPPKAVMLSHDNITWTGRNVAAFLKLTSNDVVISYLPLSHIAAQMIDIHSPMVVGSAVYFAQPDALKGSLLTTLKEVRPTLFLGVPRVWEKMYEKMREIGKSVTGFKKNISDWAKGVGLQSGYADQNHESRPWGFWAANKLVFSKVRDGLGLDRARLCASAAAPIAKETLDYFLSLNIPIYEIYGMSECSGPQTLNLPEAFRIGFVGKSMPGTELKLDHPNEEGHGEICYRGRHVFMGYMKDDKNTAETIDEEGFLHSGDVGVVKDGFLAITGRIKELIITAGGENIPPILIEDEIKKELGEVISNIMLIGDRKKFLSAVFTLKTDLIPDPQPGQYPQSNKLTAGVVKILSANGAEGVTTVEEAMNNEAVRKFIQAGVERANKKATSNAQRVQKFIILPRDFTIEGGELTPTLKLKRRVVAQQYNEDIEKMYVGDE